MSLINDALRRASTAAPASAVPPVIASMSTPPPALSLLQNKSDPSLPPLREPVEEEKSKLPFLLCALFAFCVVGAAGIYVWEKKKHSTAPAPEASVKQQGNPSMASAAVAGHPTAPLTTHPAPEASAPGPAGAAAPSIAPTPAPAVVKPVPFPSLRLQSIFYRPSNPSVMISGRTLYLNDEIQGVTVAAIDPSSVTLVLSGQTNVLTLR